MGLVCTVSMYYARVDYPPGAGYDSEAEAEAEDETIKEEYDDDSDVELERRIRQKKMDYDKRHNQSIYSDEELDRGKQTRSSGDGECKDSEHSWLFKE